MIKISHGDITRISADAIVNPANTSLLRGGGLCGVIHKLSGLELARHCKQFDKQSIGAAVLTPAFQLTGFQYVIHACGPRWLDGTRGEIEALSECHKNIIRLARHHQLKSLAIPAISTGIYKFPATVAAEVAIKSCLEELNNNDQMELNFVIREEDKYRAYVEALNKH